VPDSKKPVVLTILDGWGYRPQIRKQRDRAGAQPVYDKLLEEYPNTLAGMRRITLWGCRMGRWATGEVGHLNIGAGRIVQMDITRIDALIANGDSSGIPTIVEALQKGARRHSCICLGWCRTAACTRIRSIVCAAEGCEAARRREVFVHAFMDGRDTLPTSGAGYLAAAFEQKIAEFGGKLASVSGR